MDIQQILAQYGEPIPYNKILADAMGSATGGVYLSCLLQQSNQAEARAILLGVEYDGWFCITNAEICRQTRLSQHQIISLKKKAVALGLIKTMISGEPGERTSSCYLLVTHLQKEESE